MPSKNGKDETCATRPCHFVDDIFYWALTLEINHLEIIDFIAVKKLL